MAGRPQVSPGARGGAGGAAVPPGWPGGIVGLVGPRLRGARRGQPLPGDPLAVAATALLQVTGKKSHPFFVYVFGFSSFRFPQCVRVLSNLQLTSENDKKWFQKWEWVGPGHWRSCVTFAMDLEAGDGGCCMCFPKSHGKLKKWSRW